MSAAARAARRPLFRNVLEALAPMQARVRGAAKDAVFDHVPSEPELDQSGYFNNVDCIHTMPEPIAFGELEDMFKYKAKLAREYAESNGAWLTPAEIFRPWYAQAIMNWVVETHKKDVGLGAGTAPEEGLVVIELGGGSATHAVDFLDSLRAEHPELYRRVKYVIVEISHRLSAVQEERLRAAGHNGKFGVCNISAADWCVHLSPSWCPRGGDANDFSAEVTAPVFVIGLEVLDNLPHDKVLIPAGGDHTGMREASVQHSALGGRRAEVYAPLRDAPLQRLTRHKLEYTESSGQAGAATLGALSSLLSRVGLGPGAAAGAGGAAGEEVFLPTVCLQVLEALHAHMPAHHLLLADFDFLPGTHGGQGAGAPLVAAKRSGGAEGSDPGSPVSGGVVERTQDYSSYLDPPLGVADIFFPTDFELLRHLYLHASAPVRAGRGEGEGGGEAGPAATRAAMVRKHGDFFAEHAQLKGTRIRDGCNPLIEDYGNMSVLVASSSPRL